MFYEVFITKTHFMTFTCVKRKHLFTNSTLLRNRSLLKCKELLSAVCKPNIFDY